MHFVEEQDGATLTHLPLAFSVSHGCTNVLHAGHDRRQCNEVRFRRRGDDARERCLAGAGRPPEHHRMCPAALDGLAQRLSVGQQMLLAVETRRGASGAYGRRAAGRPRRRRARRTGRSTYALRARSHDSKRRLQPPTPIAAIASPTAIPTVLAATSNHSADR